MFKFLHTADIHLDSPLLNLDRRDDLPRDECRSATRRAFDNVVELAIREPVAFVLIAGDLYDGDCSDFNTPRYFRAKMQELGEHGIRVFLIQGNHDAANSMKTAFRLQLPDNVWLLSTDRPETVRLDDFPVAIHGQGFKQRAVLDDLSQGYPAPVSGCLNIGMLHTSCRGHDSQKLHDTYAPSTVRGLKNKNYDYWALGHIHKRERLAGPAPWIVYPGNPQGRHVRESGPRGCVVATCDGDRITVKEHDVDVLRWEHLCVDVTDCEDGDGVLATVREQLACARRRAEDKPVVVRVELTGASAAHFELVKHPDHFDREVRTLAVDDFDESVWIEKFRLSTTGTRNLAGSLDSAIGDFIEDIREGDEVHAAFCELQAEFEKMLTIIPSDPRLSRDELELDRPEALARLVTTAQDLLISRLIGSGSQG